MASPKLVYFFEYIEGFPTVLAYVQQRKKLCNKKFLYATIQQGLKENDRRYQLQVNFTQATKSVYTF